MKLVAAGRVVLILEGFDEMALVGDPDARLAHFQTLWEFCYPAAKMLVSGRPNFFLDDHEMRAALGISKATAAGPYCEAVHLVPFDLGQIESALRDSPDSIKMEILELARRNEKFFEIVSRGSLLYVVSQLWEREGLGRYSGNITSALVMDLFIEHSYRRQSEKAKGSPQFMVLTERERRYFTTGVAAFMGSKGLPNQITREAYDRIIRDLFELIPSEASTALGLSGAVGAPLKERLSGAETPLADISTDVRSTGILVSDQSKSGALRFAHKSFMEYLVAKAYANFVLREDRETSSAIIKASNLTALSVVRQAESQAFFSEILLGSVADPTARDLLAARRGARFLMDLIVTRPFGGGLMARWMTKIAVQRLVARARVRTAPNFLLRLVYVYSGALLVRDAGFLAFSSIFLAAGFVRLLLRRVNVRHDSVVLEFLVGFVAAIPAVMSLLATRLRADALDDSIRLWFTCCVAAGIDPGDISSITGSKGFLALLEYLDLKPTPSRSPSSGERGSSASALAGGKS